MLESLKSFSVRLYDPVVPASAAPNPISFGAKTALEACQGADVLVIMTPWSEFTQLSPSAIAQAMRGALVIDPYATLNPADCRQSGLEYITLGV